MKKRLILAFFVLLASFSAWAGCINGNWPLGDYCCIEVGDGTVASCTDGQRWFLVRISVVSTPSISQ